MIGLQSQLDDSSLPIHVLFRLVKTASSPGAESLAACRKVLHFSNKYVTSTLDVRVSCIVLNRASSEALLLKNLPPFYSESQPLNSLATRLTGDALAGVWSACSSSYILVLRLQTA